MNMVDRAAAVLLAADTQMRTWDDLTDDDREPYRRITRRMLAAAGVLVVEAREHGTTGSDTVIDAVRLLRAEAARLDKAGAVVTKDIYLEAAQFLEDPDVDRTTEADAMRAALDEYREH